MPNPNPQIPNPQLTLVIVGHVDHGKSTLIGRLLHDMEVLPPGKEAEIRAQCERRGMPFEWSFLTDALQAERDQGITIETSQIWFSTDKRRYGIIDAPGHKEFLKNMVSGASQADAALLIIDAREGVQEQTRRHAYLLHLLGMQQVVVVVNKMDAVAYDELRYKTVCGECQNYLEAIGVKALAYVPISAQTGQGVASAPDEMPWYSGPSVLSTLDGFTAHEKRVDLPLRLPVQDVYKFDERRIIAGQLISGHLKVGDELLFSPGGGKAKVASIERWPESVAIPQEATAGQSIGITLDAPIFVERGEVASHETDAPFLTSMFRARVFWLGDNPLTINKRYRLKIGPTEIMAELREIEAIVHSDTLEKMEGDKVERHMVAEVIFRPRGIVAVDAFTDNAKAGRFVIIEEYHVAGGGIIDLEGFANQRVAQSAVQSQNITRVSHDVSLEERIVANGHLPGILWFSGLSGSGKSTLAQALQKQLFKKGCQVYVLDGDNVRHGLCRDLGFSEADRHENLRRAGEVAALFARAGFIVITSFISPRHDDRSIARAAAPDYYHSVHVHASLETCEARDVKGLYKKARAGEIENFTGISAPYDPPQNPDMLVNTEENDVETCVQQLMDYVTRQFIQPVDQRMRGGDPSLQLAKSGIR